jgi:hypothetical protein
MDLLVVGTKKTGAKSEKICKVQESGTEITLNANGGFKFGATRIEPVWIEWV